MESKNIELLCRMCLKYSESFKNICDQYRFDLHLYDIINDVCQLDVSPEDDLPKFVCLRCHRRLLEFHDFKLDSHKNRDILFRIKMSLDKVDIKKEDSADDRSSSPFGDVREGLSEDGGEVPVDHITPFSVEPSVKEGVEQAPDNIDGGEVPVDCITPFSVEPSISEDAEQAPENIVFVKCELLEPSHESEATPQSATEPCGNADEPIPQVLTKCQPSESSYEMEATPQSAMESFGSMEPYNVEMSYFVVLAENWCAAIPSTWIDEEQGIYRWPRNEKIRVAICRHLEPDASWHADKYDRVLGPYDTLKEAREVEVRMAELSTEDEEQWESRRSKGKRRVKRKNFDDYIVELGAEGNVTLEELLAPPAPFKIPRIETEVEDTNDETPKVLQISSSRTRAQPPSTTEYSGSGIANDRRRAMVPLSSEANGSDCENGLADLIKREFEKLHSRLERIERRQEAMENKLDFLLALRDGPDLGSKSYTTRTSLDELPSLPLTTMSELQNLEGKLQNDEEVQRQLKLKVKMIGGVNGEAHLRKTLCSFLSNNLAYDLTWKGPQHGSKKGGLSKESVCLSTTKFSYILLATVLESHPTTTIANLERAAKQWLQHAGDRIKYAEKKRTENSKD